MQDEQTEGETEEARELTQRRPRDAEGTERPCAGTPRLPRMLLPDLSLSILYYEDHVIGLF